MRTVVAFAMLLLIAMQLLFVAPQVEGVSSAGMHIEGPSVIATNSTVHYRVIVSAGFDKYICTLLIGGENLTGLSPINQTMQENTKGIFDFRVHAPNVTQVLYLSFKAYGIINSTGKIKVYERTLYVEVKKAYTVIASIKNTENYTVSNVTVNFYIDNRFIGNVTVDKISPNSTKKVTYYWVPDVGDGVHNLKMTIDASGVVFGGTNANSYARTIYIGKPPNYNWVYYLGVATLSVLVVILIFQLLFGKKSHREQSPKWKK